jgi:cell division septum initiation protein DivIVA
MLSEGDRSWLQAFFNDIEKRLDGLDEEIASVRRETKALAKSLDGFDEYVRKVLTAEHRDTDHAEAELAKAQEALREAELEQIAALERHERKVRGTGGE